MKLIEELSDEELIDRAVKDYFRHGENVDQPAQGMSTVEKHNHKDYIAIRNSYRLLAVYEIKSDRLRRVQPADEDLPQSFRKEWQ